MTVSDFTVRLISHGLAELGERAREMTLDDLHQERDGLRSVCSSSATDLVAAVLDRELERRRVNARVET